MFKLSVASAFSLICLGATSTHAGDRDRQNDLPLMCDTSVKAFNQTASDLQVLDNPSLARLSLAQISPFKIPNMKSRMDHIRSDIGNHYPKDIANQFKTGYQPVHVKFN